MTINGLKYYLTHPKRIFIGMGAKGLLNWIPDKQYIKIAYRLNFGKKLNLDNPQTFNEKLQWLKLYDRNPLYTRLADKYEVRKYIVEMIGEEHLIPLIGGPWNSFEEIDFDALPHQFVLKCNHDSGSVVICNDKNRFDRIDCRKKLQKGLKTNFSWMYRERQYDNIPPKIIAEKYMVDESGSELKDYKFFCFNGKVVACFIATERFSKEETKFTFFDSNFAPLPFTNGHPQSSEPIQKPVCFEEMKHLSEILAGGIPQVRIDFYVINNAVYFGEMTFFHWSGMTPFDPPEWDLTLGSWLQLPVKSE